MPLCTFEIHEHTVTEYELDVSEDDMDSYVELISFMTREELKAIERKVLDSGWRIENFRESGEPNKLPVASWCLEHGEIAITARTITGLPGGPILLCPICGHDLITEEAWKKARRGE